MKNTFNLLRIYTFTAILFGITFVPALALAQNLTPGATPIPTPGATPIPTPGATPISTPGATPIPIPGATPNNNGGFTTLKNPLKADIGNNIWKLIDVALNLLLTIASIGAVLYIMYVGFEYVTARGDEKKISDVHQKFLWGAVGIGVIFSAKVIAEIIGRTIDSLM